MPKESKFKSYVGCDDCSYYKNFGVTAVGEYDYHGATCICITNAYGATENKATVALNYTTEMALDYGTHTFKSLANWSDEKRKMIITKTIAKCTRNLLDDDREFGSSVMFAAMSKDKLITYRCGVGGIILLMESGVIEIYPSESNLPSTISRSCSIQSVDPNSSDVGSEAYDLKDVKGLIMGNTTLLLNLIHGPNFINRVNEIIDNASEVAASGFADLLYVNRGLPKAIGILKK